jgi:DNA primase catalytic subunit
MIEWLSYDDKTTLARREFSFTLDGDIYKRFLEFDEASLKKGLLKDKPIKVNTITNLRGSSSE